MADEKTAIRSLSDDVNQVSEYPKEEDGVPFNGEETLEKWNHSRTNMCRYFASLFSFIIMGTSNSSMWFTGN